jgi:hypothetical protein
MTQWKPAALIACLLVMGSSDIPAAPANKGVAPHTAWNPDTQALEGALKERGFGETGLIERKKRHLEVHTRRNGVPVIVEFGPDGNYRAWKLPKEQQPGAGIDANAAVAAAAAAGYGNSMVTRIKARHTELVAVNSRGETVEVHVDGDGRITRERLLPAR